MNLHFGVIWRNWSDLLKGAGVTLWISAIAMAGGFVLGLFGCLLRRSGNPVLRGIGVAYVNLFRNTPLLVQAYLIYFGLPTFGINLDSLTAGVIALTINNGGYMTEIIRAGLESIHRNEIEAALAVGMSYRQVLQYIVIPHIFRLVYPPMVNQFVLLILGSSVLALIGLPELTFQVRMIEAYTFRSFEAYLVSMMLYVVLTILSTWTLRMAGWRFLRSHTPRKEKFQQIILKVLKGPHGC